MVKNPPANAEDPRGSGSIPGLGRSPGKGHSNPLQYLCPENPMDRGALLNRAFCGEGVEKREPSYTVGGNADWDSHYGKQCGDFLKNWK